MTKAFSTKSLDHLKANQVARVLRVIHSKEDAHMARQLEEIGFISGEKVQVLNKAIFGGDSMVVRIGASTFALRKAEAQLIEIGSEH